MLDSPLELARALHNLGAPGLAALAIAAIAGSLAFVPRNLFCLIGGFVFGWVSIPVLLSANATSAGLEAVLVRRLFHRRVAAYGAARPICSAVLRALDQEGWRIIALVRLAGPLPSSVFNCLLGLTNIRFATIMGVSLLASAPQTILFVYFGTLGHSILLEGLPAPWQIFAAIAGAVTVALIVIIVGRRTRAILEGSRLNDPLLNASAAGSDIS